MMLGGRYVQLQLEGFSVSDSYAHDRTCGERMMGKGDRSSPIRKTVGAGVAVAGGDGVLRSSLKPALAVSLSGTLASSAEPQHAGGKSRLGKGQGEGESQGVVAGHEVAMGFVLPRVESSPVKVDAGVGVGGSAGGGGHHEGDSAGDAGHKSEGAAERSKAAAKHKWWLPCGGPC